MLRSVVNDERFPLRLSQNLLLLAMEDAMNRGEKRDIIYAITHPLMDRNAPRIQNLIQIYGRYADTDLDSSDSLKKCYKDVTNSINFPSSFGVIAKIFERSLELGDIDLAKEISLDSKNWKTPPALERRKEIISKALSQSLERSEGNIVFAKEMRAIAIKYIKNIDRDNIFSSADYRKELDL